MRSAFPLLLNVDGHESQISRSNLPQGSLDKETHKFWAGGCFLFVSFFFGGNKKNSKNNNHNVNLRGFALQHMT